MAKRLIELLKTAKSLMDNSEFAETLSVLETAIEYSPPDELKSELYFQQAVCLLHLKEHTQAEQSLKHALNAAENRSFSDNAHIYNLLRITYKELPDYYKLAALCRKLLVIGDERETYVSNLLYACVKSDKWGEMASALDEFPDIDLGVKALLHKVICYTKVGSAGKAFKAAEEYIDKFGEDHEISACLMLLHYSVREAEKGFEYYKKAVSNVDDPSWLMMAASKLLSQDLYYGAISNYEYPGLLAQIRKNSERLIANTNFDNTPKPFRKLRLGYLSADFTTHPVGYFLLPVMVNTVTSHSFIKCYSLLMPANEVFGAAVTEQFKSLADEWQCVYEKPDSEIAGRFLSDKIDIAFDMMSHSTNNRLQLYAHRLAPVQISWIGFPVTTGLAAMDYIIGDRLVDPPGSEKYYTEKLLYMPDNFLCHVLTGSPEPQPPAVIKNGYITFACFHNFSKITDQTLRMWSRILERDKTARLKIMSLLPPGDEGRKLVDLCFKKSGLDMERVSLSPMCSMNEYLAAYNDVDIMLDTYPFSGATTTFDALRMGRPIITLVGERHVTRVSYSLLTYVGLDDLAAFSEDEYVENAIRLANDRERLLKISQELSGQIESSPLTDQVSFRKNYEKIIRDVWVNYCFETRTETYDYTTDNPPDLLEQIVNATVWLDRKLNLGEDITPEHAVEYYRAQKAFCEKLYLVSNDEQFLRVYNKFVELMSRRLDGKNFRLIISMAKRNLKAFCDGEL